MSFPLQSLIRVRNHNRDQAAEAHRGSIATLNELGHRLEELLEEQAEQRRLISKHLSEQVDSNKLTESQRYQSHLRAAIEKLQSTISMAEAAVEQTRKALIEREREVQAITRLHNRFQTRQHSSAARSAQRSVDEWSSYNHWAN